MKGQRDHSLGILRTRMAVAIRLSTISKTGSCSGKSFQKTKTLLTTMRTRRLILRSGWQKERFGENQSRLLPTTPISDTSESFLAGWFGNPDIEVGSNLMRWITLKSLRKRDA